MNLTRLFRQFPVIGHFVVPLVLLLAVCGGLTGWRNEYDKRVIAQAQFAAKLRHERENTAQYLLLWAQASDSLLGKAKVVTVTRDRLRLITDTIRFAISHGDTNVLLSTLPRFLASSDSAMAACTQYQTSCERYRHVSDSLVASLRRQITIHESRTTPSLPRFRLTADALYDPVTSTPALGAGLEMRVAGPVSLTVQGLERFGEHPRVYVGGRLVF
jgi:hypothetical protein